MTDKEAVLKLEETWHVAPLAGDLETVANVVADDWLGFGPSGESMSKSDLLEMLSSRPAPFDSLNYKNVEINLFDTTAVVTSLFEGVGKELTLTQRFMRVYSKRNNEWKCVATQIIPIC